MLPAEAGRFEVPAQGAADAAKPVGDHRLPVARAAQHDGTLELAAGDGLGRRADKVGVIDRFGRVGAEVVDFMAGGNQQFLDGLFVFESRVVGTQGNFHVAPPEMPAP